MTDTSAYRSAWSDKGLRDKLSRHALRISRGLVEQVLVLWQALRDPATPLWARTVITGALGYFISPIDAVPDLVPVAGYVDDLGVIVAALATVAMYVTDAHRAAARERLAAWFGGVASDDQPEP